MFIVLGNLYFSIGSIAYNYYNAEKMVTARAAVFMTIIFCFFIAIFFEIYFNCVDFKYSISLVMENNKLSLKFGTKPRQESESKALEKTKKSSMAFSTVSEGRSKSSSNQKTFDLISDASAVIASPQQTIKKSRQVSKEEEEELMESPGSRGLSKTKAEVEIEMVNLKKKRTTSKGKKERANSEYKKKWGESLL